jgi:hypothetical protein
MGNPRPGRLMGILMILIMMRTIILMLIMLIIISRKAKSRKGGRIPTPKMFITKFTVKLTYSISPLIVTKNPLQTTLHPMEVESNHPPTLTVPLRATLRHKTTHRKITTLLLKVTRATCHLLTTKIS